VQQFEMIIENQNCLIAEKDEAMGKLKKEKELLQGILEVKKITE
jgi:hypothetical protein